MAAWTATAIRDRHPEAFLCWAVESRCAAMIERTTLVSRVEEMPRDRWKRAAWSPATWQAQIAKYTGLRRLRFDVGIDLQGHSKTALCLRLACPKTRIATRATDPIAARLNPRPGDRRPGMHVVEWHEEVMQTLGDYPYPDRPTMPRDPEAARTLVERIGGDRPLATIAVSGGHANKTYPAASWLEVAKGLAERGFRVAFLGGPHDRPMEAPNGVDLVGKLALSSTLEAVRLSAVHLACDTGTGHMAAALGVPVVSVFGPTNPDSYRPYTDLGRVLREGTDPAAVAPAAILDAVRDLVGR